jgi:hypothetical protein
MTDLLVGVPTPSDPIAEEIVSSSSQQTAKKAIKILEEFNDPEYMYKAPTIDERRALLRVFAGHEKALYGKAFDMVRIQRSVGPITELTESWIDANFHSISVAEIKSTNRTKIKSDFRGYFFALTAGELLVAQSLGKQFVFLFVNVNLPDDKPLTLSLQGLYQKAQAIYPTWSVRF